ELHHARGERERVMIGQRHDAGAQPDGARALGRGGDEHLRAADDLEAARVMLADPCLVIVETVEMLDQLHVAVDGERRVLTQRMEGREKDSGPEIAVLHGIHGGVASGCSDTLRRDHTVRKPPSAMMMQPVTWADMSDARKTAGPAMSSGLPGRPSGVWRMTMATKSGFLARASALILVSISPGPMALTRTPSLPSSAASARVKPSTPCLEVVYAAEFGQLTCTNDWIEPMLTIRPLVARSWSRKACVTLNMPSRLIDRISSQSLATAAASPVIGLRRLIPALLTRIETLPFRPISLAAFLHAARSVTSSLMADAWPPLASIRPTVSLAPSRSTSSTITLAPSRA